MTAATTSGIGGTTGTAVNSGQVVKVMTHEIDLADYAATVATTETIQICVIPADTYFEMLQVECVTAVSVDASTQRIDVGDSDIDQFVSNASTVSAGTNLTIATPYCTTGRVAATAETVTMTPTGDKMSGGTANATGIIRFTWLQADSARRTAAEAGTI